MATTEERNLRKYLKELTSAVTGFIVALDTEMQTPESHERGNRIALLANKLDLANDMARHFGLGQSLKKKGVTKP